MLEKQSIKREKKLNLQNSKKSTIISIINKEVTL